MPVVIACPSCKRTAFARRDLVYATIDGLAHCRACGRSARLDLFSRWVISCMIALVMPALLLYGNVFYSGHLFLVAMCVIFGGWALLSWIAFPLLTLEPVPDRAPLARSKSIGILAAVLLAAVSFDAFMASRFEPESAQVNRPQNAGHGQLKEGLKEKMP